MPAADIPALEHASADELAALAAVCRREILALADARLPLLSEPIRQELKRWARIQLLWYEAHYGPGAPYEAFRTEGETN